MEKSILLRTFRDSNFFFLNWIISIVFIHTQCSHKLTKWMSWQSRRNDFQIQNQISRKSCFIFLYRLTTYDRVSEPREFWIDKFNFDPSTLRHSYSFQLASDPFLIPSCSSNTWQRDAFNFTYYIMKWVCATCIVHTTKVVRFALHDWIWLV